MPNKLKEFLQRWIITTAAVLVAAQIVTGIKYDSGRALLIATLVLGLLNAFLRPLLLLLSLPLLVLTLGLFTLIINALLLWGVGRLIDGFHVEGFRSAFWGALIISVISVLLNSLTGTGNARISVQRGRKPPPPNRTDGDGNGPVIDV